MFDFRKKVLNPLVDRITRNIDAARQTGKIGERIENLLSAKEAGEMALEKVARRDLFKGAAVIGLQTIAGLFVISTNAPFVLFLFSAAAAFAAIVKMVSNVEATKEETTRFRNKIESEVQGLAAASPEEALKSPRYLEALKERFNLNSAVPEAECTQLRLLLAPGPAATPAGRHS